MFIVEKKQNEIRSLPAAELSADQAAHLSSALAQKIIKELIKQPAFPFELSQRLNVHEQKIYYHIRKLERAGILKVARQEQRQGTLAKYYEVVQPAFVLKFKGLESTHGIQLKSESDFLSPFIENGKFQALIIVGSPDPHGPEKARSRDGYYGMDLALFLGTFLNYVPNFRVKLDTEVSESDLKENLLLIGGPIVNSVTAKVNKYLPIKFDKDSHFAIKSSLSGNAYPSDECGLIVKANNPFDKQKQVLVVAGKRYPGTRAAIIAFLRNFSEISSGNIHNKKVAAKVVEGVDLDSDGLIDAVEIRE